ncbi:MAG: M48 family metallopeptidase [Bacteroidia bacterium]
MKFKQAALLILAFSGLFLHAQSEYTHSFLTFGLSGNEKIFSPDYKAYAKQLKLKYDSVFKDKDDLEEFIQFTLAGLYKEFENGTIYTNWNYAEEYLNKILSSIIPSSADTNINIKIIRTTDVNAFMTGTGQAYITVGFLANALNEAEIASVLGHEYGHYVQQYSYKYYKAWQKNQRNRKIGRLFAGYGGNLFSVLSTSFTYGGYRDMEREADQIGIEHAKAANYNLLSQVNVMRRFKLIEDNREKNKDHKSGFYFHTHPPTNERIEYGEKAAAQSDTTNALYFKIDANLFKKVKQQAIDECINLLLQQQDFEGCIEMCYRQLIQNPDDEFYLFYVNEALRRFLLIKPEESEKLFITGRYTTYTKFIPADKKPVYIMSSKIGKTETEKISQTIFYHYEYLMLADKNKLLTKLPDNALTRNDTLEFVTNGDALKYFISQQEKLKQGSVEWVKNYMLPKPQNITINSSESFLNNYNSFQKNMEAFTPGTVYGSVPTIFSRASYTSGPSFGGSVFDNDSLPFQCREILKSTLQPPFTFFNHANISFSDRQIFSKLVSGLKKHILLHEPETEKLRLPLLLIVPEMTSFLEKYKLQTYILTDLRITNHTTITGGEALNYNAFFNIYCFDFKNGYISHVTKKIIITTFADLKVAIEGLNTILPSTLLQKN